MMRAIIFLVLGVTLLPVRGAESSSNSTNTLPSFDELYQLLRKELKSLSAEELDRAAVRGLIRELPNQVLLVTNPPGHDRGTSVVAVSKKEIYDGAFGYVRLGEVNGQTPAMLQSSLNSLNSSNRLKGLVLDLRFAGGTNYPVVAEAASLFSASEQPLFEFAGREFQSKGASNRIDLPLAVLINAQTRGAAEALAGVIRQTQSGLLLGNNSAGQVGTFREHTLSNGFKVQLLSEPVRFASGQMVRAQGLKPDVEVLVTPEEERIYFDDPYKLIPRAALLSGVSSTNRSPRRRINEAELVRLQREANEEEDAQAAAAARRTMEVENVVHDPVLGRALDLLKGLSLVRKPRNK